MKEEQQLQYMYCFVCLNQKLHIQILMREIEKYNVIFNRRHLCPQASSPSNT